jgi:uncharacterized protein YecE (DUF72 family)
LSSEPHSDEPKLGASFHGTDYVTAPIAYLRLQERNHKSWFNSNSRNDRDDYLYTLAKLKLIADSIKSTKNQVEREDTERSQDVIAATNNHFRSQAATNAIDLKRLLGI